MGTEFDRLKMIVQLENTAKHLEAVRVESFVDNKNLCRTCSHAHIMRQHSKNNVIIKCHEIGRFVPDDIKECNSYANILQMNLHAMSEIAILLNNKAEVQGGYI